MKRTPRALLITALLIPATYTHAVAQTVSPKIQDTLTVESEDWVYMNVRGLTRRKSRIEDAVKASEAAYQRQNTTGLGISEKSYALADMISKANRRSSLMRRWLSQDLNADGKVSKDELETVFGVQARRPLRSRGLSVTPTPSQVQEILNSLVAKVMINDLNGDKQVDFTEAMVAAEMKLAKRRYFSRRSNSIPLSMDANGDKVVSLVEFTNVVSKVLAEIDTNGDRSISKIELEAIRPRVRQARRAANQMRMVHRAKARLAAQQSR